MCQHEDYVSATRREALFKALSDRGLPHELCDEICAYLPPSPLCAERAFGLLSPRDLDALRHEVLVEGQDPLTLWYSECGMQHSLTMTRQRLRVDPSTRLVFVDTREYDVVIAPKHCVADWYAYDEGFVTILGEVREEFEGAPDYTLMYHPYCLWGDARTDMCGVLDDTPEMLHLLHTEGIALRNNLPLDNLDAHLFYSTTPPI